MSEEKFVRVSDIKKEAKPFSNLDNLIEDFIESGKEIRDIYKTGRPSRREGRNNDSKNR